MGKKGKKEVSPIELNDLERIREYFDEKKDKKKYLNFTVVLAMINIGVNIALRYSDLVNLKFEDINISMSTADIIEKKTKKNKTVFFNDFCISELEKLVNFYKEKGIRKYNKGYIFKSLYAPYLKNNIDKPMAIQSFNRCLTKAQIDLNLSYSIGSHSLRKTWGSVVYNSSKDIGIVMKALNHSSEKDTLQYIGVDRKVLEELFKKNKI